MMMNDSRSHVRFAAFSTLAALGLGVFAPGASAATTTVWLDVNGASTTPGPSGVTDGSTYSWEAPIWSTAAAGAGNIDTVNFPDPGPGFPRFAAGTDAVGSYTVTANANHLIAGMFLEDGAVNSTLTLNGTGVLSI